jgi:hypothetical protein
MGRVALGFQDGHPLAQGQEITDWTREAATLKNAEFDLGHVQPTSMLGVSKERAL